MEGKVFVNSAIATKEWRRFIKVAFWFLVFMPICLLVIPFGLIWVVSLGHINLLGIWDSLTEKIVEEKLPGGERRK